ncbi:MAG: tRNA (N6-isopentenyl adenosine(37)-C2)-methylthiotransferase MiaB [Lachnospiraceae bacterium]|nr:tRNA (N6-isopentenyl adenosine(37)-C2)-methylthiotransferase MiaB [Lachnospiraceae bacterium]
MFNDINLDEIDLTESPPEEEPNRQYYFMAKCRELIRRKKEELGHPLSFCIKTFGCQMNARDSEKLQGILEKIGYIKSKSEMSTFVIYNTCTVRENVNLRVYGRLGYLHALKKKNPHMMIGLCGCMMQEPKVVEKLKNSYRFVDLIFGTHNIYKLAELVTVALEQNKMIVDIWKNTDQIVENLPIDRKYFFKSGVNIMFGCNNFCSYCIVPYVRGRERSRRPEEILEEIRKLVNDGVKEIMLLGQNVNSYGQNLAHSLRFAGLLEQVAGINGLERIRFMTSHPKDLSEELIEVMSKYSNICPHLHLPVQSGSTNILRQMNRRYTKEFYLALVDRIRSFIPDISLTTDIIIGFPGETEKDFMETIDVVEKVRYDSTFMFIYSKRTGTPAAEMDKQIPEEVIKERFNFLLAKVKEISRDKLSRFEGKIMNVLVEAVNEQDPSLMTGRLANNLLVHFPGNASMIGTILPVYLNCCNGFYYIGSII